MNSKYAHLTALRFNDVNREGVSRIHRYLVSAIFPAISRAANQGLMFANLPGPIDDEAKEALEKLDYVIHRKALYTEIHWGPQNIVNDFGKPERISCQAYNLMCLANKMKRAHVNPYSHIPLIDDHSMA